MTTPAPIIRRSSERGHANHGWLDTKHTFSFADYYDPAWMGFRALRVINEDTVQADGAFGAHPHRDMEILTYVLDGVVGHRDSMGNGSLIHPGEIQRMSAGTGVRHSERNATPDHRPVHFLQIWIEPDRRGYAPSYEQRAYPDGERRGRLRLVASRDGTDGAVRIHQDARVYLGSFDGEESATLALAPGRHAWLHVVRGSLEVGGERLDTGDALGLTRSRTLRLAQGRDAEVLVFDLP